MSLGDTFSRHGTKLTPMTDSVWKLTRREKLRQHRLARTNRDFVLRTRATIAEIESAFGEVKTTVLVAGSYTWFWWQWFAVLDLGNSRVIYPR
jgi:hypothetical protein